MRYNEEEMKLFPTKHKGDIISLIVIYQMKTFDLIKLVT